ncbi:MAG: DNA mismatch repair endonuclease MutL [Syntrophobacteraceae bacterium]|nr:DNA mismatch repair endonuclease MutL [Syntrophobacteraceae bacterium]
MGKIAILPDILCNQIAAGEVVERPSAVVKELVENSIDARSTKISVSLLDGGRREISVVDNGCGMSPEDSLLSLERHATSKIRSIEDLDAISSLGFRGEALPSIAAVSRFELNTCEHGALFGTSIRVEGGVIKDVREKGLPPGARVLVRDLFFCLPARRKFLRKAETELAYITDQFLRVSLANPHIHLQLKSQEKMVYDYPGCEGLLPRASRVLGAEVAASLSPVDFEASGIAVSGLIASPDIQRTNSQGLFLFVNGRAVYDRLLQRAVLTAYEALITRGKYPVAVLFVAVPPERVDVNVHPAKREVRFRHPGDVISTVRTALFEALSKIRPKFGGVSHRQPEIFSRQTQAPFPRTTFPRTDNGNVADCPRQTLGFSKPAAPAPALAPAPWTAPAGEPEENPPAPAGDTSCAEISFSKLNLIGQLANSFILLESIEGLVLIDQHAAHERIVFSGLAGKKTGEGQLLTTAAIVDLLPKEGELLKSLLPSLAALGFEIEPFGGGSFAIHAAPASLSRFSPEEILRDYLRYAEEEYPANEGDILLGLARTASCHGSVRAGQKLKVEEIKQLLETLDSIDTPFTCPHGRPLSFTLPYDQIYRFFKRS